MEIHVYQSRLLLKYSLTKKSVTGGGIVRRSSFLSSVGTQTDFKKIFKKITPGLIDSFGG